jgi:hypothetical protein
MCVHIALHHCVTAEHAMITQDPDVIAPDGIARFRIEETMVLKEGVVPTSPSLYLQHTDFRLPVFP